MKRRTIALAVVLSLLLSVLMPAAVSSAEELAPLEAAESMDSPAAAAEEAPEDLPEEAPPESSAPATAAEDGPLDAPADEQEQPDEGQISADEQPFAEASSEEPQADWTQVEADVPEEDAFAVAALGSDNVQYAGVTYLSQAAFASMSDAGREVYVRAVDEITDLLDRGVPLYDVVFALYEDGDVAVHFATPLWSFSEGEEEPPEIVAEEASPSPEDFQVTEASPASEAAAETEEAATAAEESADAADLDGEDAPAVHSENVERIESLKHPAVRVREPAFEVASFAAAEDGGYPLEELREQFEQSKRFFYNQFTPEDKAVYDVAKASMLDAGMSGFECDVDADYEFHDAFKVFFVLMDSYPWRFDWSDGTYAIYDSQRDEESGTYTISVSMDESSYYSEALEQQAQEKAESLVSAALSSARKNYPYDLPYGMVRYFDQWLCAHNYYNTKGMYPSDDDWSGSSARIYYYCHSSYGTLLKGYGVCESYAKAMSRLLDTAGIPNLYVTGGNHAWNNVQMINGVYYLVDSTWNDRGNTSRQYLLSGKDSKHKPDTTDFSETQEFKYPTLPSGKYSYSRGPLTLKQDSFCLRKGKSATIKISNPAYKGLKRSLKSSNSKVVKVSGDKITAVGPGEATVTLRCAGKTAECAVSVYQVSSLSFDENGASSLTREYAWEDAPEPQTFPLTVAQKVYLDTAENIDARKNQQELSASSSKNSVATASAKLSGDAIELTVTPVGAGDATIKVGFGGKTATLKFRVRRALEDEWFRLEYEDIPYNGKARKPKVSKTELAPGDLKFNLRYANNTNAGIATVSIVGKGNYGTLEKRFFIEPAPFDAARLKITEAKSAYYNGAPQGAGIAVKLGKKKLKAGADYELLYDGSPAAPTEAGTYAVTIRGKNYAGTFGADAPHSFTIMPAPLSKLKLALKKTSVKANGSPVTAEALGLTLKYGKREIPANEYEIRFRNSAKELISAPSEPGSYTVVIVPTGRNIATDKKTELTKSFKIKR